MIKGVIFDLDGVLTFTDKFHYLAWKSIADEEGIYFDEVINNRLRGVSRMDSLEIILEKANKTYSVEEKEALAKLKNDRYVELLDSINDSNINIDTIKILKALKEKGIKLAVGSASKNTIKILTKTNLLSYFDAVADGNMITHSKPNPEVFLKAAKLINLNPEECLVIEDAEAGIKAGHDGGFITCGIGDAAKFNLTNHPIDNLMDILKYIDDNKPTFKLNHLKKIYQNGVCAVKDFNLEINDGEFVVFVGPSGCGKSTVLRMIAGLEEISDGELLINDVVMNEAEPKDRDIAMVFQNYALYPHLSVRKNIGFALLNENIGFKHFFDFKYRKARKNEIYAQIDEVAKKIGLTEYLDRKPANLSGGQRQRVALGRAIIRNPKAFLLDEPLSNLDAKMRSEMRTEISKLHNDLKTIFIYVTHDQVEAMTMGTKIVVMKDGYIQQIGTPQEIFMHPVNKFVAGFIGTPQMNFFNGVMKEDGILIGDKYLIKGLTKKDYLDKKVILGVRPKAIKLDNDSPILGTISLSEQLGDEALVYFKLDDDSEYVASLQTYDHFEVGKKIGISIDISHASIFDAETEEVIN